MVVSLNYKILLLCGLLGGCTPVVHQNGWVDNIENVKQLKVGVTTKDQVMALLGTPTLTSTRDENRWYYVSRVTECLSTINRPRIIHKVAYVLSFDSKGILQEVETIREGQDISPVSRETPTKGYTPSVFQQMFKNLGRVDSGGKKR